MDDRIFMYPHALLASFYIEISNVTNSLRQDGIGLGPASCHSTNHSLLNNINIQQLLIFSIAIPVQKMLSVFSIEA